MYQALDAKDDDTQVRQMSGGRRDFQLYWLLRELCSEKPEESDGRWICPNNAFRRNVDYLFLSIGGNDIGFSSLVSWVSLQQGTTARLAGLFGATITAKDFATNIRDILPGAFARLARALETSIPLRNGDLPFDPARVVLTAYPDILVDENEMICAAGDGDQHDDSFAADQSLDAFASWLSVGADRLAQAHAGLKTLHKRMSDLAGDHGWTFAGRAYEDAPFRGHGFCAQNQARLEQPTEMLVMPCWGARPRPTATCGISLLKTEHAWQPYDPQNEVFPYALRQRWVRTFNDAYLVINEKVLDRQGRVSNAASRRVFAETTGAMHPTAEGQAAMADAILLDLRASLRAFMSEETGK
jgi:lysophospholipase L1-like esterase